MPYVQVKFILIEISVTCRCALEYHDKKIHKLYLNFRLFRMLYKHLVSRFTALFISLIPKYNNLRFNGKRFLNEFEINTFSCYNLGLLFFYCSVGQTSE